MTQENEAAFGKMRKQIVFTFIAIALLLLCHLDVAAQDLDGLVAAGAENEGVLKLLKVKFVEGNPYFMSLVLFSLIIGMAFCIERIITLSLADINVKRFMNELEEKVHGGDMDGARDLCLNTRGPVAALCLRGLERMEEPMEDVERSVVNYGAVLSSSLEKGCSWITLFISIAPSLGFLGTVVGMVMAFDNISIEGDISPTIVADGMKVALITTIFGIIVALILQVFYNYVISKIEGITRRMEESAIVLLDIISHYQTAKRAAKG